MIVDRYVNGQYFARHPTWDVEDSPRKAAGVLGMIERHSLPVRSVCEVGCGAGEILKQLHDRLDSDVRFVGYDISPQAIELAQPRATERLRFELSDIREDTSASFDLILLMDVIEHVEDYLDLLRTVHRIGDYKILHIPLDLCALTVARPHSLVRTYDSLGHLHYFLKDTALKILTELNYEILETRYTISFDQTESHPAKRRVLNATRRAVYRVSPDLAARLLGGYSLLVLAR